MHVKARLLPNEEYLTHETVLNAISAFAAFVQGVYTQVNYMKKARKLSIKR